MRLILLFSLFICSSPASAETDSEVLTRLLTDWDPQSLARVQQIEALSSQTKSADVALRSALILAYAPETNLKVKPHNYANFALQHRKILQIEDLFSLYRIAGDGFFENSDFKKANIIYDQAIADSKIEPKDREYFVYKNAWVQLNLKQPAKAYSILKNWLTDSASTLLRNPMMVDLGRSWGETLCDKKQQLLALDLYKPKSDLEIQQLTEGLLKSLQRGQTQTTQFYQTYFSQQWPISTLPMVLDHPLIQKKGICEIMNMKKFMSMHYRSEKSLLPRINECSVSLLKATKKSPSQTYSELAAWMQSYDLNQLQLWTVARLWARAQKPSKACDLSFQMISQMLGAPPDWSAQWLQDLLVDCQAGLDTEKFQQKLLTHAVEWKTLRLEESLMESTLISAATKKSLLQEWFKGKTATTKEDQKLLLTSLSSSGPEYKQRALAELCPMSESSCAQLWDEELIRSPQMLKAVVDSSVGGKNSSSPVLNFIYATNSFFKNRENIEQPQFQIPDALKTSPFAADLNLLQNLANYRQKAMLEENLTDEHAVESLTVFQAQSSLGGKHRWFSSSARDKARHEISLVARHLKNRISLLGATNDEKKQWQIVGKTLNKWVIQ